MENVMDKLVAHYKTKSTLINARSRINRLMKLINVTNAEDLLQDDCKTIIKAINNIPSKSRALYAYQLKTVCKLMDWHVSDTLNEYCAKCKIDEVRQYDERRMNEPLNKDIDIQKVYEWYKSNCFDNRTVIRTWYTKKGKCKKEVVLPSTYTKTKAHRLVLTSILKDKPIRLTEMVGMKMKDDGECNYVDIENKCLVIRNDKSTKITKRSRPRNVKISDDTINHIKWYRENTSSLYLFPALSGKEDIPMTQGVMITCFMNIIKLYCKANNITYKAGQMGIHNLRSQYQQKNFDKIIKLNIKTSELKEIFSKCRELGHTPEMALLQYTREK
jgi:hypothetical protein